MKRGSSGICALIAVDKPRGCSSHDVVSVVRRATGERRVGHAGTLDPFATGLIVIGIGPATRLLNFVMDEFKTYNARISFGCSTLTDDLSGEIVGDDSSLDFAGKDSEFYAELLNLEFASDILSGFLGKQEQLPPYFSAKKFAGKKSYELARAGEEIELTPVNIEVRCAKLAAYGHGEKCLWQDSGSDIADNSSLVENSLWGNSQDNNNLRGGLDSEFWDLRMKDLPWWDVCFSVSKGTYIRALARDIGKKVGCGAFLSRLRRTSLDNIPLKSAIAFDDIEKLKNIEFLESVCLNPCEVLGLPSYECSDVDMEKVRNGAPIEVRLEDVCANMRADISGGVPNVDANAPQNLCITHLRKLRAIYTIASDSSDSDASNFVDKAKYKSKLVIPGGIIGVKQVS